MKNIQNKKRKRSEDDEENAEEDLVKEIEINTEVVQKFRMIEPYRSIGQVIDYNPVSFFKRGNDRFVLVSNYHSFLIYNLEKLRIERISPPLSEKIDSFTPYKNKIFTSSGGKIYLWDKIHIVKQYFDEQTLNTQYPTLITFENLLIAKNTQGVIVMFDINNCKMVKKLNLNAELIMHPSTYLNKLLFTKKLERFEEDLQCGGNRIYLYNINTEKQIFEFEFKFKGQIKVINQSPVIDVVGVGFSTGDIVIFNLKTFKILVHLKSEYSVDTISFSNCVNLKYSLLATTGNGVIFIWDLNKQSLHFTISNTFKDVSSLLFLPNEPILLATSGRDNSIKMFRLDLNTATPFLLKQRTGHSEHPMKLRFYGDNVNNESTHIISMTSKEIRNLSIINEHLSKEFSVKHLPKEIRHELKAESKMNFIDFDFNEFRERDWANLAVSVKNSNHPILFSYENSAASDTLPQIKTKFNCTAISVSMCGNFGFAGFENGNIEKFNMQSGFSKWQIESAHGDFPVISLKSDSINSLLVSIGLDKKLNFWDIFQSGLVKSVELKSTPSQLDLNRDNDLVAVSFLDGSVSVFDKSNFKLVRDFAINAKINDLVFSNDGKWLIVVCDDKSLKIFDILSGNLIEWVVFRNIPVSVSISPNNQYIAISYAGLNGVYLWINRSLFVDFLDIEEVKEPIEFNLPFYSHIRKIKTRKEIAEEENAQRHQEDEKMESIEELKESVNHENQHLIMLSKENKLKYRILNNLEKIQERNEPFVKKKEKAKAPFFLFDINNQDKTQEETKDNQEFMNILKNYSHFKNEKIVNSSSSIKKELILDDLLRSYSERKVKSSQITQFLNSLNPYLIDLEIRSLDPFLTFSNELLYSFLDYLHEEIESKANFELVQAYLNRFLKIYSDSALKDKIIKSKLEEINKKINDLYSDLDFLYRNTLSLISHFGNIQI